MNSEPTPQGLSLIPGTHRFNLHAFYGEFRSKKVTGTKSSRSTLRTDRLGQFAPYRIGLQSDVLLASESSQRFTCRTKQGHPAILDRALQLSLKSVRRWDAPSARPQSRTSGFPTA